MSAETNNKLMLKYLEFSFPVRKIKFKNIGKFQRAIFFDGDPYSLKDKADQLTLFSKIQVELNLVFSCEDTISKSVLAKFLNFNPF